MTNLDLTKIYREIIESSGLPIWAKDLDGRYLFASREWFTMKGIPEGEFRGRTDFDLMSKSTAEDYASTDAVVARTGQPFIHEVRRLRRGKLRDFIIQKFPIHSEDGEVFAIGGISTETSEVTRLRSHYDVQLALIEGIFNAADNGIARLTPIKDANGEVVDFKVFECNSALCRLAEYSREELIGVPVSSISSKPLNEGLVSNYRTTIATGEATKFDYYESEELGGRILEIAMKGVDEDVVICITDNSQIHADRERLRILNRQLDDKNRQLVQANEQLDHFTRAASHDLNEPLRKILAFSDLLAVALKENDQKDVDYALNVIGEAATRGRQLVSDLLAYSRTSNRELDIDWVDLHDAIDASIDDLSVLAKDRGVEITNDSDKIYVAADRIRLSQLVTNLLANAIKYAPADRDGEISIATEVSEQAGSLSLSIQDNGIGIDNAYLEQIFEPFKRLHTRQAYPGTGLGLTICKMIADQHGWRLAVDSAPGVGSTFGVEIPHAHHRPPERPVETA